MPTRREIGRVVWVVPHSAEQPREAVEDVTRGVGEAAAEDLDGLGGLVSVSQEAAMLIGLLRSAEDDDVVTKRIL
jgi:hypothetical protein